jgi:hypothetical protein
VNGRNPTESYCATARRYPAPRPPNGNSTIWRVSNRLPITELIPALSGVETQTYPRRVQMRSRDLYWHSPVKMTAIDGAS